ncbi:MAG TPA: hypothetical protein P5026_12750, partial [Kiritimatiellia bacterium]|nr:hypothetical protein [Kiritimatiellia bacterium]
VNLPLSKSYATLLSNLWDTTESAYLRFQVTDWAEVLGTARAKNQAVLRSRRSSNRISGAQTVRKTLRLDADSGAISFSIHCAALRFSR